MEGYIKPKILIIGEDDFANNVPHFLISCEYGKAVSKSGGLPIVALDNMHPEDYVVLSDGLLPTGGPDIHCGRYGEFYCEESDFPYLSMSRENLELRICKLFLDAGKPILGICQGFHQLNRALGGDLYINFKLTDGVEHYRTTHTIKTVQGSFVNRLFGDEFIVNSTHNVRVGELADDFIPTAYSPDGVLEAFEHKELPVYGFQWHHGRMRGDFSDSPYGPNTDLLFKTFVEMCIANM